MFSKVLIANRGEIALRIIRACKETYDNRIEFLRLKAYAYQLYFNYLRKNRYRDNKSPVEILRERFPEINEGVLNLPPIRLETLLETCYKEEDKSGYDVPISVRVLKRSIMKS